MIRCDFLLIIKILRVLCLNYSFADQVTPITQQSTTIVLQKIDVPKSSYELGIGIGYLAPNTLKPWHLHRWPELSYVIAGEVIVTNQGQPVKIYIAGQSYPS